MLYLFWGIFFLYNRWKAVICYICCSIISKPCQKTPFVDFRAASSGISHSLLHRSHRGGAPRFVKPHVMAQTRGACIWAIGYTWSYPRWLILHPRFFMSCLVIDIPIFCHDMTWYNIQHIEYISYMIYNEIIILYVYIIYIYYISCIFPYS